MPPRYIRKDPNYIQKIDNFPKFCKVIQALYKSEYNESITHDEIMFIVENCFNQIRSIVAKGDKINFRSFGTFTRKRSKEKFFRGIHGKEYYVEPIDQVSFKPSKNFKMEVREYEIKKESEEADLDLDSGYYDEEE